MRNKFLDTVLSSEGYYCLFSAKPSENKLKQYFFESIQDLCVQADESNRQGYDVYFALATFEEKGSRKVDNIKNLRSFFLDLDCGVGKDYESQNLAVKDLRAFCDKLDLPKPINSIDKDNKLIYDSNNISDSNNFMEYIGKYKLDHDLIWKKLE